MTFAQMQAALVDEGGYTERQAMDALIDMGYDPDSDEDEDEDEDPDPDMLPGGHDRRV